MSASAQRVVSARRPHEEARCQTPNIEDEQSASAPMETAEQAAPTPKSRLSSLFTKIVWADGTPEPRTAAADTAKPVLHYSSKTTFQSF